MQLSFFVVLCRWGLRRFSSSLSLRDLYICLIIIWVCPRKHQDDWILLWIQYHNINKVWTDQSSPVNSSMSNHKSPSARSGVPTENLRRVKYIIPSTAKKVHPFLCLCRLFGSKLQSRLRMCSYLGSTCTLQFIYFRTISHLCTGTQILLPIKTNTSLNCL